MTHNQRLDILAGLNWIEDETAGRDQICAERCEWITGNIEGVASSAWLSEVSGMVYLHADGAPEDRDFKFEAFCEIVAKGWPKRLTKSQGRGFDFGED